MITATVATALPPVTVSTVSSTHLRTRTTAQHVNATLSTTEPSVNSHTKPAILPAQDATAPRPLSAHPVSMGTTQPALPVHSVTQNARLAAAQLIPSVTLALMDITCQVDHA